MRGLIKRQGTSIDLLKVTIKPAERRTRFVVRMRNIVRTRTWDQMVFIRMTPPKGSAETWWAGAALSPQKRGLSYASMSLSEAGTDCGSCDPLKVKVAWRRNTVSLDVPSGCLPSGGAVVSVESITGYFRSDPGRWTG